eukprot:940061-Pyramimonas_sp.AAC.1
MERRLNRTRGRELRAQRRLGRLDAFSMAARARGHRKSRGANWGPFSSPGSMLKSAPRIRGWARSATRSPRLAKIALSASEMPADRAGRAEANAAAAPGGPAARATTLPPHRCHRAEGADQLP